MAAAVRRIYRWMAALAIAGVLVLFIWKGVRAGGGFAFGAALSIVNFHWLKGAVDVLGAAGSQRSVAPVVIKFALRYALIGLAAYAIFRGSVASLPAFFAGLFVFVAGVLAEMLYELATGTGSPPDTART